MAKKVWLFFIYLIIGVYALNIAFNFIPLPEFFLKINKWVLAILGIIAIIESFKYLKEYPTGI